MDKKHESKFAQAIAACEKRNFQAAKRILQDIIAADPSISEAYRLLGQIAFEEGNDDKAIDNLIEALRIDPKNLWALIMIGNIYSKHKGDYETARQYYDKVLEYHPNNAIALNNIAAVLMERKQFAEAVDLFKKVITLDSNYPNCYYGLAIAYLEQKQYQDAFDIALEGARLSVDRPENKGVRQELLSALLHAAQELVKQTNYMQIVLSIKNELEAKGTKIEIKCDDTLKVYAKLQYAKHHNRDVNVILYNSTMENVEHLMIHEMGHLRMQLAADAIGRGKVIHCTKANNIAFNRKFGVMLRKKLVTRMQSEEVESLVKNIQEGIGLQLMNCPLDLFVERYIYENYPMMRPMQILMLFKQEQDNIQGVRSGEVTSTFPLQIVKANKVMNICTSMHFKELYHIDLINEFKPTKAEYEQAKELLEEFHAYWDAEDLEPGEEYELVQYFLDTFDMGDIMSISSDDELASTAVHGSHRPMTIDGGDYDIYTEEEKERQRNFEENSKKEDPARDMMLTMYILSALEEFATKTNTEVKKIAMEIAMLGMNGIDPAKQSGYRIASLDKDFGGYLMLAYYYTSWKIALPEAAEQLGLPYRSQYEAALQLFENKYGIPFSLR